MARIDQDLGTYVDRLFNESVACRQPEETAWRNNYAWLYGNQWTEWTTRQQYTNYLSFVNDKRVRMTVNKLRPIMAARTAFITGENPSIYIDSTSPETEHKMAAYTAQCVARADWEEYNLYDKILRAWDWTKPCGIAYLRVYFDPGAGKYIGQSPTEKDMGQFEGKIKIGIPSPFSVVYDPLATMWEEVRYVIVASVYAIEDVESMGFELTADDLLEADKARAPTQMHELTLQLGNSGLLEARDLLDQEGRRRNILVLEYFEKPTPRYPHGRYDVVINKKVRREQPLEIGEIPIVPFFDSTEAGIINAQTPVTEMRPIQEMLNRLISLDWERSQQPDMIALPRGGGFPKKFGSKALIVGEYDPRTSGPPVFVAGGQIRQDYVMKMRYFEEQLENIAGVSSIASRARPPYEMSGRMGYIVNESNRSLLNSISYRFGRSCEDLVRMRLRYMARYYNEERLMSFINEYDRREIVRFLGQNIGSNWAVRVRLGSNMDNPQNRANRLLQLSQNQMIMQALMQDQVGFKKYVTGIDPELGHELFVSETDVNVAQDENFEFSQGGNPSIQAWNKDPIHLIEHKRALDSDAIKVWPEQCVKALIQHYYGHEGQIRAKAREAAFQQGQMAQMSGQQEPGAEGGGEAPPGVAPGPAGPETPIEAIDQTLEAESQAQFPGQGQVEG